MGLKEDIIKYQAEFSHIPDNKEERLIYMIKEYNINNKDTININEGIKKLSKIKWNKLEYVLYLVPKATPRPRFSKKTKRFFVKDASNYSSLFKAFIESRDGDVPELIVTPTKVTIDAYLPIPNSGMTKLEKILAELGLIRPVSTPDFDNLAKTYTDMVQRHLLLNDSLIIDGRTRKFYSRKPRIEVKFKYMDKHDSRYNKKKVEGWKYFNELEEKIIKDSII